MIEKKTIGLLTIGQSPRPDMTADLTEIFADKIDYIEAGALDGLSYEQVLTQAPKPGEHFLVTRMTDGTVVKVASRHLYGSMQQKISQLEQNGASAVLVLCTEAFQPFQCSIPVFYPNDILKAQVSTAAPGGHIGVILPDNEQLSDFSHVWKQVVPKVTAVSASPYAQDGSLQLAAAYFAETDVDLIVLDCMGYTADMQQMVSERSGKPVYLAKTLAAEYLINHL